MLVGQALQLRQHVAALTGEPAKEQRAFCGVGGVGVVGFGFGVWKKARHFAVEATHGHIRGGTQLCDGRGDLIAHSPPATGRISTPPWLAADSYRRAARLITSSRWPASIR